VDVHQHDSGDARGGVAGVRSKAGAFDPPGERLADRAAIAAAHRHPSPSCSTLGVERAQTAGGRSTLSRFPWCPCSDTGSSSSAASASLANASSIHEDHTLAWVRAPGPPRFKPQGQAEKGAYRAASGAGSPRRQPRNPSSTRTPAYATPRAPVVAAKRRDAAARRYDRACGGIGGPRHGSPSANPPPTHGCGGDAVRFQVPRGGDSRSNRAGCEAGRGEGGSPPIPTRERTRTGQLPRFKAGRAHGSYVSKRTHAPCARARGCAARGFAGRTASCGVVARPASPSGFHAGVRRGGFAPPRDVCDLPIVRRPAMVRPLAFRGVFPAPRSNRAGCRAGKTCGA
jgi:hypothetical protein